MNRTLLYIPIIGIIAFILLFIVASFFYPGGSVADEYSKGFDWSHNYWCNLTANIAINGQPNPARPLAIIALIILCVSLQLFFISFSIYVLEEKRWKWLTAIGGILSMVFTLFVFTSYHDLMTTLSSLLGLIAIVGVLKGIWAKRMNIFIYTGILCLLLIALNNFIYYTHKGIYFLPLLQKITFLVMLGWIAFLQKSMIKRCL